MNIAIGISGASGAVYAKKLIELLNGKHNLFVSITKNGLDIFRYEIGIDFRDFIKNFDASFFEDNDFYSPIASGSFIIDVCAVVPCSMKTLSAIANGYADSLIVRCADIAVKQKKQLILLPRETPLSSIHLENMLKLSRLGVSIVVPSAAFYFKPKGLDDMVDFIVSKVMDEMGIDNNLYTRWGAKK